MAKTSILLAMACTSFAGQIIYVDIDANGLNNGSSWTDAYNYLQDAIATATVGDEILVAQGIYKPDKGIGVTLGDRRASFHLKSGVTIKGGYTGFGEPEPDTRDVGLFQTILSGDLNGDDVEVNDPCDLLNEPSRYDNSSHVVIGSNTDETAVIDGFTISAGHLLVPPHMDGGDPSGGAGMYISSGSPTVVNCIFTGNATLGYGGGMINRAGSNPTIVNCTFTRNNAGGGGGISFWQSSEGSNPKLIDCMFDDNYASGDGGGMYNYQSNPVLNNCIFKWNLAENNTTYDPAKGGGIYNRMSNLELTDCTFNENTGGMGGGMYSEDNSSLTLINCIFMANLTERSGGGMYNEDSNDLRLIDCMFSGNSAERYGGGMHNKYSNPTLINCIFSGNKVIGKSPNTGKGGGLYAFGDTRLIDCTFTGNWAQRGRAISKYSLSDLRLNNCILWDGGNEIFQTGVNPNIAFSNIQGGWEGEGNIDVDPLFADPGYWADAYDPNIVAEPNDPNAVWVDGDYHLKSQAGRWDTNSQSWLIDDVTSPCIDAGDPNSPIGHEPFPNGGIINMGAYGGTAQASKSYFGKPVCETIIAGDINGDCKVDFEDLMILMAHWLEDHNPKY